MGIFSNNELPTQEQSLKIIEETLLSLDVSTFTKYYDKRDNLTGIYFIIDDGTDVIDIRLPFSVKELKDVIQKDYRRINKREKFDIYEHAERVTLVELSKYIESIAVMVKLGQITLKEAFLAFSYDKEREITFFEAIKNKEIKFIKE